VSERTKPRFAVTPARHRADIAAPLLAYLRERLGAEALSFAEPATPILGGFDTSIYAFSLADAAGPFSGSLIARVFRTPAEAERARYEAAIQNAVASLGYPAPEILIVESRSDVLGSPFIVMRRMPGRVMLDALLGIRMRRMAALLGREHARLHSLDADTFRRNLRETIEPSRRTALDEIHARYEDGSAAVSLAGLRPALRWLDEHRPTANVASVICHGDFHPLNVLVTGSEVTGVLDWGWVAIGRPALDVGATVALLTHGPVNLPRPLLPLVRVVRRWIVRRYLEAYAAIRPIDLEEVRYFEAFRLFDFACEAGEQMLAEAGMIDSNMQSPFSAPHVRDGVVRRLRQLTGTPVSLPASV
jgi:aminoglycoside phosphotransferase (APT) family kinase protein